MGFIYVHTRIPKMKKLDPGVALAMSMVEARAIYKEREPYRQ